MDNTFNIFYAKNKQLIDKHYSNFNVQRNKYILGFVAAFVALTIIFLILMVYLDLKISFLPVFSFIIICAATLSYLLYVTLKREMTVENEKLIKEIVTYISHDTNASYEPNKRIKEDNIKEMELFNLNNLKYNGKNTILVNYKGNNMSFADMEVYYIKEKLVEETTYDDQGNKIVKQKIKKFKKHIFDGCYISATLNKRIAEHIYMIPNNISDLLLNGAIRDYITYSGDEVKLENLDLSKKYKVYSDDEIQARYVLSMSLMERINKIDNELAGKKYIVFKEGRRFVICLEDFKIEDLRKSTLPIIRNEEKEIEAVKYIYSNILKLFKVYDILDLGNDLYVD